MKIRLTEEQNAIVSSASNTLKVVAFAGTGKTSTLRFYAEKKAKYRILYLAFNKSIAEHASKLFPSNVTCKTTHALAFRTFGNKFKHKLRPNFRPSTAAEHLGFPSNRDGFIAGRKAIKALEHFLASNCYSYDEFARNKYSISEHGDKSIGYAGSLWECMKDENNTYIPMLHDGYLKLYQMSSPKLDYDIILFDEAQDANPSTLELINTQQTGKVFVGDPHQQIYQFRRAINSMDQQGFEETLYLTISFRFGNSIAEMANRVLSAKREINKVRGYRPYVSSRTRVHLTRGNAAIYTRAAKLTQLRKPICFIGGINGYRFDLLTDIYNLKTRKGEVKDAFIKKFKDFDELDEYATAVEERDLLSWIQILKNRNSPVGIPEEIEAIKKNTEQDASKAYSTLGTAHKSKGLEFGTVELARDFPGVTDSIIDRDRAQNGVSTDSFWNKKHLPEAWDDDGFKGFFDLMDEEINLLYVALTRAEAKLIAPSYQEPYFHDIEEFTSSHPKFIRRSEVS